MYVRFSHIIEMNPLKKKKTGLHNRSDKLRKLLNYFNYHFKSRMLHVTKLNEVKIPQKFE